jgi:hypothetical protein
MVDGSTSASDLARLGSYFIRHDGLSPGKLPGVDEVRGHTIPFVEVKTRNIRLGNSSLSHNRIAFYCLRQSAGKSRFFLRLLLPWLA